MKGDSDWWTCEFLLLARFNKEKYEEECIAETTWDMRSEGSSVACALVDLFTPGSVDMATVYDGGLVDNSPHPFYLFYAI